MHTEPTENLARPVDPVVRRFSVAPMMDWITKALIHLGLL